jgi:hypothetical protein
LAHLRQAMQQEGPAVSSRLSPNRPRLWIIA